MDAQSSVQNPKLVASFSFYQVTKPSAVKQLSTTVRKIILNFCMVGSCSNKPPHPAVWFAGTTSPHWMTLSQKPF